MAKTYRVTTATRLANLFVRAMVRAGIGVKGTYLLTVRGRKSGEPRSTPVTLLEDDGRRWLVAPYGEVSWVRNARAAGRGMLSRGGRSEAVGITEVGPEEAAPVLKKYAEQVAITRPYFDAQPGAPIEEFEAEAARHPVFRIGERSP